MGTSKEKKTAAATAAVQDLLEMGIDRHALGRKKKMLILGWAALCGNVTEPESNILLGRAGELKRLTDRGYLRKIDLPPGLKASPHFPHHHYFHLTDKGMLFIAQYLPHLAGYGNRPLPRVTYLHDHIARIEAAWRVRVLHYVGYTPECRLPDLSYPLQKQHDGHLINILGQRVGMEVELGDEKTGDKLAKFAAQCLNSVTNDRVQGVLILTPTNALQKHYAGAFIAGKTYCPEWVLKANKWKPNLSSQTVITPGLARSVRVEVIRSKKEVEQLLVPHEPCWPAVGEVDE